MSKRLTSAIMLGLLSSSCTFSAPQFEASARLMERLVSGNVATAQEPQSTWLASVGQRGAVLRPYASGGLTIFANADGDAIAFDGWTVRSIIGFGLSSPVSVAGKDGSRVVTYEGAQTTFYCGAWRLSGLNWGQVCATGDGQITLDDAGNIHSISMAMGERLGNVTLRVAK